MLLAQLEANCSAAPPTERLTDPTHAAPPELELLALELEEPELLELEELELLELEEPELLELEEPELLELEPVVPSVATLPPQAANATKGKAARRRDTGFGIRVAPGQRMPSALSTGRCAPAGTIPLSTWR